MRYLWIRQVDPEMKTGDNEGGVAVLYEKDVGVANNSSREKV